MTEEFPYQAYDLKQVLTLLQGYLGDKVKAYEADVAAFEAHKATVWATYQAWPHRSESCAPEWREFSPSPAELAQWQGVAWPKLLQEYFPSLRRTFIVTGAEMTSSNLDDFPKSAPLCKRLMHALKRRAKTYAWKNCRREIADRKGYNGANQAHLDRFWCAEESWRKILSLREQEAAESGQLSIGDIVIPRQSILVSRLQECAQELDALAQKQGDSPVLWLDQGEAEFLRNEFSTDTAISTVLNYYQKIAWGQDICEFLFLRHEREQRDKQYELERFEDPAFMGDILECIRKSETGTSVLAFAERNGTQIHLNKRKHDINTLVNPPAAFYDQANNCVELICDDPASSSNLAFILGHELVHVEQENLLKNYPSDLSPVDYLVRTRLIEAHAFAIQRRIGYEMKENGVELPSWSSDPNTISGAFELYADLHRQQGIAKDNAVQDAATIAFIALTKPGRLDQYENSLLLHEAKLYERPDLPDLISKSPFFQADFICGLASCYGDSYLPPDIVQKNLLKIGRSKYARPKMRQAFTLAAA